MGNIYLVTNQQQLFDWDDYKVVSAQEFSG